MKPKVSIILLNTNGYKHTKQCIESLNVITYPNYEVIIVDNASTDGSGQKLKRDFPQHKLILNKVNLGFARGCNVGIRYALMNGTDYVLLLNNDSVVEKDFLQPAIELSEGNKKVGIVSGKIYLQNKPGHIWYAGGQINLLKGKAYAYGCGQKDQEQFDHARQVEFAVGALMLIKRIVLDKVGLLPEEYFLGYEDEDYSLAVRRAGYSIHYVPEFVSYHKVKGDHHGSAAKYIYSAYRSKLIFMEKYLPLPILILWKWVFLLYHLTRLYQYFSHSDKETLKMSYFALKQAIRDHKRASTRIVTVYDLNNFETEFNKTYYKNNR